jgi:hydrogenase expression/formation protein HypD
MLSKDIERAKSIIMNYDGPTIKIMEVCGTHTHEIFKLGIRNILPDNINLISGPGCPVCVTPTDFIDEAIYLALEKNITICTFGDLIRVPGTNSSLGDARSKGANIQIVYSPLDSVEYAINHPDQQVVFLSVGFETTTPASCIAVRNAKNIDLKNFSILGANKTMYQAYLALKDAADAYIYPGHVCTMTGMSELYQLRDDENVSGAVTGFSASEILSSLAYIISETQKNKPFVANLYPRVVTEEGLIKAKTLVENTMESCDSIWRGLGNIEKSGMKLKKEYIDYDARAKYDIPKMVGKPNKGCRCGEVLRGDIKPFECPLFSKGCTPEHPIGACMVSSEGACSAYYKYGENLWKKN